MASSSELSNRQFGHQHVVSRKLWDRLTARIAREHELSLDDASRVFDQTLGFLRLVALVPHTTYSPSPMVDKGWHTLILYTEEYAALCQSLAGRFIHHVPLDGPADPLANNVARTVLAMRLHGLHVDEDLWNGTLGDCCGENDHTCVG